MQLKKIDILLFTIALALLLVLVGKSWIMLIKMIVALLLISLLLYWKLFPYRTQIEGTYKKAFDMIDKVFSPIVSYLSILPKIKIGQALFLDASYLVIVVVLVIILIVF